MFPGIIFGLLFGVTILCSGWVKLLILIITRGILGNRIPFLYLFLGIHIGNGLGKDLSSDKYWPLFISSMLSALIVNQISAKYEMRTNGFYGTVSTSGSMALAGGFLGMLYHLIFA